MKDNHPITAEAIAGLILGLVAVARVGMGTALAQDTGRIRGIIERVDGAVYLVKARLTAVVGGREGVIGRRFC
jgi:hypothetical protein